MPTDKNKTAVIDETKKKVQKPKLYHVILLNDDYTSMEFVVEILIGVFNKPFEEATKVMYEVHTNGQGLAGIYTKDIAETKISKVHELAKNNEFPLRCILKPE